MSEQPPPPRELTRAALEADYLRQGLENSALRDALLTDEQLDRSLEVALAAAPAHGDVWLFAYGSLVWNPIVHFAERRVVTVHGFHRRFCLWSRINRGTPAQPGLVLGLDRGGCCTGVAYRLRADQAEAELRLLWRREMLLGIYRPRWLSVADSTSRLQALGFAVLHSGPSYAGRLPDEAVVECLCRTAGKLGRGIDYLRSTIDGLAQAGITDRHLLRLDALARGRGG